jgi:SAM-dependent methyltransferase
MLEISDGLRAFSDEYPYERWPILHFVAEAARALPAGARVADVGAGRAPYRELFGHVDYVTIDWANSLHADAFDVVAPAHDIPEPDASFDAVLCTQVLEHVPDPAAVLAELHRLLRPGGTLYLSVPFAWEQHELPYDFFRYTQPVLERLLASAGFSSVVVVPRGDTFSTLAQLLLNARWTMGRTDDGLDALRDEAVATLAVVAERVGALAPLDSRKALPLGFLGTAIA